MKFLKKILLLVCFILPLCFLTAKAHDKVIKPNIKEESAQQIVNAIHDKAPLGKIQELLRKSGKHFVNIRFSVVVPELKFHGSKQVDENAVVRHTILTYAAYKNNIDVVKWLLNDRCWDKYNVCSYIYDDSDKWKFCNKQPKGYKISAAMWAANTSDELYGYFSNGNQGVNKYGRSAKNIAEARRAKFLKEQQRLKKQGKPSCEECKTYVRSLKGNGLCDKCHASCSVCHRVFPYQKLNQGYCAGCGISCPCCKKYYPKTRSWCGCGGHTYESYTTGCGHCGCHEYECTPFETITSCTKCGVRQE